VVRGGILSKSWFALLALVSALPLFLTRYAPLQDAPAHAGAIRVLSSIGDPAFGIGEHFTLSLGRTQYVLYYFVGATLAKFISAELANRLLAGLYIIGTPFAIRAILRACDRDERAALLCFPLVPNPLFMLGLFPFLIGVTVMLFGIAASIRFARTPSKLGALSVVAFGTTLFFLHIFPLALYLIVHAALSLERRSPNLLWKLAPIAPIAALFLGWTVLTNAGHGSMAALLHPNGPTKLSLIGKAGDIYNWVGDTWKDLSDEVLFGALALLTVTLIVGARHVQRPPLPKGLLVFVAACVVGTFALGDHHDHIYPIWQRFPILLLFVGVVYVPWPTGNTGTFAEIGARLLALSSIAITQFHFAAFNQEAMPFDDALTHIPAKQKVATLIFDKKSPVGHTAPYLHFASYYEARKGGLAVFTYAGYPHWPYMFREGAAPPGWSGRAPENWEWYPDRVDIERDLAPFFDYTLVRGNSPADLNQSFDEIWSGVDWHVWKRRDHASSKI